MGTLETSNLFIDTEYFDSINYGFQRTALKELVRHAKNGRAKIFLTSVTLGEMRTHLETGAKEAEQALKTFRDKGRILRNLPELPIHSAFLNLDTQDLLKRLHAQMDTFLKDADVEILDLKDVQALIG